MNRVIGMTLALAGLLLCRGAVAGELWVEALLLPHAAPWQRGAPEQEEADDAYYLERPDGAEPASQLVLMRHAPLLKADAETYFNNLTRHWRSTYGKAVLIDWQEIGGAKWLYLRRPARENGLGVFQLSTVFQGRAYSLLVFVPGTVTSLPAPVQSLLAGMRWVQGGGGTALARDASSPVPPPERWVRAGTHRFRLSGPALEAVAGSDADAMGGEGLLTGFGLDYGVSSLSWFVEGYTWTSTTQRQPWAIRGTLDVEAPAQLDGEATWTLRLGLGEGERGVQARLREWDVCGPAESVREALSRLDRGLRGPLDRLIAQRPAACPPADTPGDWPVLAGESGKTVSATWPTRVPHAVAARPPEPGLAPPPLRVRLLEALLESEPGRGRPGEGVLDRARLFFAYELR